MAPHGHRIYSSFHPCPDLRAQHTSNKLVFLRCQRIFPMRIRSQPFQTGSIVDRLTKRLWQPVSNQDRTGTDSYIVFQAHQKIKKINLICFSPFLSLLLFLAPPSTPSRALPRGACGWRGDSNVLHWDFQKRGPEWAAGLVDQGRQHYNLRTNQGTVYYSIL